MKAIKSETTSQVSVLTIRQKTVLAKLSLWFKLQKVQPRRRCYFLFFIYGQSESVSRGSICTTD